MTNSPNISDAILAHSQEITSIISDEIKQNGPMPFEDYMQTCLYHPQYGYYRSRDLPMGKTGDFITAPEISPLFSYCLAKQTQELLEKIQISNGNTKIETSILELGAGSGRMASDILTYLKKHEALPQHYHILEPCQQLRAHQEKKLKLDHPDLFASKICKISWLNELPDDFTGVILANEVFDALPVQLIRYQDHWTQMMVDWEDDQLMWATEACPESLLKTIQSLDIPEVEGYTTEINRQGPALLKNLALMLNKGAMLFIDYGMPRHEFYHPQRHQGTLRCHLQHHVHDNPLQYPGCQDITAHVDFTQLAETGLAENLALAGYTHQAAFLLSLGIHEMSPLSLMSHDPLKQSQQLKQLMLPSGMGELFKVIAFTKYLDHAFLGFKMLNQREKLFPPSI